MLDRDSIREWINITIDHHKKHTDEDENPIEHYLIHELEELLGDINDGRHNAENYLTCTKCDRMVYEKDYHISAFEKSKLYHGYLLGHRYVCANCIDPIAYVPGQWDTLPTSEVENGYSKTSG